MENLCILCCVISVTSMSTLNKQAWMTTFVVGYLLKKKKKKKSMLLPCQIWCPNGNLIRESMWQLGHVHACLLHLNEKSPSAQVAGKVPVFSTLDHRSNGAFDGHFSFPTEILTGCCRWSCLTFSGCSDGFSICHGQGHRPHCTGMGRGCQDRREMARHFPYYLTTAVRLQNKNRMPGEAIQKAVVLSNSSTRCTHVDSAQGGELPCRPSQVWAGGQSMVSSKKQQQRYLKEGLDH